MNPLIVTIVISLGTFIVAIFGASWLNQQQMNKRIDDLRLYLEAEFKTVRAEIGTVRPELAGLTQRVDRIERQLDTIFKPSLPKSGD